MFPSLSTCFVSQHALTNHSIGLKYWELSIHYYYHLNFTFNFTPKATLATDACIGAWLSPATPGSGYVLLHHVMGEIEGVKGAWGYPEGGMGAVSEAIAKSAREAGVDIFVNSQVDKILVDDVKSGRAVRAVGVQLADGRKLMAKQVCMMLCVKGIRDS